MTEHLEPVRINSMCVCVCGHHFQQTGHQPATGYGRQSYMWSAEIPTSCLIESVSYTHLTLPTIA